MMRHSAPATCNMILDLSFNVRVPILSIIAHLEFDLCDINIVRPLNIRTNDEALISPGIVADE